MELLISALGILLMNSECSQIFAIKIIYIETSIPIFIQYLNRLEQWEKMETYLKLMTGC